MVEEKAFGNAARGTVAEQGFPGFGVSYWLGLLAPAKTPDSVSTTLAQTVISIVDDPDVAAQARHQFSPPSLLAVAVMRIARPQSWISTAT
jgi:tripartite-type tricarboxylate transporter receptor subunit TctC